jgi:hypothetical protein
MSTTAARTITTIERGVTRRFHEVTVGDYVWHRGAYRLVTAVERDRVRMGRYVCRWTGTYEVFTGVAA